MSKVDYNNINFKQFLEIIPVLSVWPHIDIFLPELLFVTLPILEGEGDGVFKHVVSGYCEDDDSVIIQPFGMIEGHEHPGVNITIGNINFVSENVCLLSGRITEANQITFSSIQGCLDYIESDKVLPFGIQEAGEQVFEKVFGNRHFFRTRIGHRYYRTTVIEAQEDEMVKDNPFTTVELNGPPM